MIAERLKSATQATCGAAALIALLLAGGCSKPGAPAGGPAGAAPVSVAAAVQRTVGDSYEFTGRLESPRWVEVRARIGGTVERVHFRDGARVAAGAPLFTIDPKPYEAELARAQSQLAAARSRAELATQDLARASKLLEAKAVSRQEFDQLTSGAATSNADIRVAEAALRIAQLNLGYTRVTAPIAGQLSRAVLTEGNLVTPQSVLTTLVSTQTVYAYFDGSEQIFLRLRKGEPGLRTVHLGLADEAGFPHEGRIDFIDNQLNAQTGSIRMRAVFDNARGEFTPGLFARLQLAGGVPYAAVLTPERAIVTDQSKKLLFVIGEGNVAQPREVQLGTLIDGMRVITHGLKAGELVVVDGLQRVRPGAPVTPIKVDTDERGMPIAASTPPAPGAPPAAPASAPAAAASAPAAPASTASAA